MGFYFRKSVNLGGLRFNLSKSGVGVSTGFKGFRIGSGPREVLMTKERWMQLKNKKVDNSAVEQTKEEKKEDIEEKIEIKDKKKNMFYKK